MFSDETLEKIFADEEVRLVPLAYQYIMVHAVENVLEETENLSLDTVAAEKVVE